MGDALTWFWFLLGLVLIITEFFLPGFVVIFLGVGALVTAAARWLGFFPGLAQSFFFWVISSTVLLVTLRHFAKRWLPSETSFHMTDEDVEAAGEIVEVVTPIGSHKEGRIRFRGTTWPAICREGTISPGQKARILYRDNLIWTVEPFIELEEKKALNSQEG